MAIVRTGESQWEKELAKWDAPKRLGGMNANGYEAFPKMLYRARRKDNGQVAVDDINDEQFAAKCQTIVNDEGELHKMFGLGWRESPAEALAQFEREQQAIAQAAAEANFAAQKMSPKAQAERKRREDATSEHVPE